MSDPSMSGSTPSGAPAETSSAPAADFGASFGTNRGSGLARGKRVSPPAPAPAPASNPGTYTPSSVQILTAASEYKNPFNPGLNEAPAAEPASVAAPAPVAVVANKPVEAPASAPVAPVAAPVNPAPVAPVTEEKAELNILPPAELKRPAQSWETPAFPYEGERSAPAPRAAKPAPSDVPTAPAVGARPDRDVFRPVRRSDVPMLDSAPNASGPQDSRRDPRQSRQPRDSRQPRQPRDPRDQRQPNQPRQSNQLRQPRDPRDLSPKPSGQPTPPAQAPKKAGGVVGWFKGLFAGDPVAAKPAQPGHPAQRPQGQHGGGPRPTGHNPNHGGQGQHHGQSQGEQRPGGGGGRRRRRGGRGRNGGGGGGPRSQGGGNPGPASS